MKKDFIYLASASPRRGELLRQIGVPFKVRAAEIAEVRADGERPEEYVRRLAAEKAEAVWARVAVAAPRPVLAADTAVVLGGRVFGKPADAAEAEEMLVALSGRTHRVLTAVALRCDESSEAVLSESEVRFRSTTPEERAAYCRSGEPLDKAGGYGIQGRAAMFVEHLAGSYSGVVGLPLFETAALLTRCGVALWGPR
jgi:septum formation protein